MIYEILFGMLMGSFILLGTILLASIFIRMANELRYDCSKSYTKKKKGIPDKDLDISILERAIEIIDIERYKLCKQYIPNCHACNDYLLLAKENKDCPILKVRYALLLLIEEMKNDR